jgi:ferredoxin/flavodoxin---NADP+ reductase
MAIGTNEQPLRVAIVGSGPAGFYAAGHLLKCKSHPDLNVQVDMFDRLPTPWGLVRAGVAPDHPNIKAVSRVYEKTAEHPEFRFYGNVQLGRDLSHEDLTSRYHAVVYAVGAQTDRRMGIPGEDLPGSWAATEFVAWYNGHPDYRDLEFDLSAERAIVVGNGNVATDVARMLALTRDELALTDVADHALDVLAESNVREIVVLGRRGPAQTSFTNPELLELGEMTDADVFVDPGDVELDPLSKAFIESEAARTTQKKNVDILSGYSTREPLGKRRRIVLRFLVSPVEILGTDRVEGIRIVHNELVEGDDGALRARPTDIAEELDCGLVFRSIGYLGTRIDGVPFDEQSCTIPNERGRIDGRSGEYAVGWIKRGPTGIIGTNKRDAQETVDTLLEDLDAARLPTPADPDRDSMDALLAERQPDAVSYAGWQAVDRVEREAGEPHGRPRVKLCSFEELLEAAKDATPAP